MQSFSISHRTLFCLKVVDVVYYNKNTGTRSLILPAIKKNEIYYWHLTSNDISFSFQLNTYGLNDISISFFFPYTAVTVRWSGSRMYYVFTARQEYTNLLPTFTEVYIRLPDFHCRFYHPCLYLCAVQIVFFAYPLRNILSHQERFSAEAKWNPTMGKKNWQKDWRQVHVRTIVLGNASWMWKYIVRKREQLDQKLFDTTKMVDNCRMQQWPNQVIILSAHRSVQWAMCNTMCKVRTYRHNVFVLYL